MERAKLKIEFDHMGNKHKHTFTPEEEDWWTSFESNGNSYDVHYDEDYGAISVYEYSDKGTDYSNTVYSKKIMAKGGSTYAEGGEIYDKVVQVGFDIALTKDVTPKQIEEFFEYRVAPFVDSENMSSNDDRRTMYVLNGVYSAEDMTSDYEGILEEVSNSKKTYVKVVGIGLDIALTGNMTSEQVENYAEHQLAPFINKFDDDGNAVVLNGVYSAENMTSNYEDHLEEIN